MIFHNILFFTRVANWFFSKYSSANRTHYRAFPATGSAPETTCGTTVKRRKQPNNISFPARNVVLPSGFRALTPSDCSSVLKLFLIWPQWSWTLVQQFRCTRTSFQNCTPSCKLFRFFCLHDTVRQIAFIPYQKFYYLLAYLQSLLPIALVNESRSVMSYTR